MKPKIAPPPLFEQKQQNLPSKPPFFGVPAVNFHPLSRPGLTCWDRRHRVNAMSLPKPRSWNLGAHGQNRAGGFSREKWVGKGTESRKSAGTNTLECKHVRFFANLWGCFLYFLLSVNFPLKLGQNGQSLSRFHPCSWSKTEKKNRPPDRFLYYYLSSTPRLKNTTSNFEWFHSRIWSICSSMFPCYPPSVFTSRTSSVYKPRVPGSQTHQKVRLKSSTRCHRPMT